MFGAGAERDFKLPSGYEYIKETILLGDEKKDTCNSTKLQNEILSSYFSNEKKSYFASLSKGYSYSNYFFTTYEYIYSVILSSLLYSFINFDEKKLTIVQNDRLQFFLSDFQKKEIEELVGNKIIKDSEKDETIKSHKEDVLNEFKKIINDEIKYSEIKLTTFKEIFGKDNEGKIKWPAECNVTGVLDSCFSSIINPAVFGKIKFSKIFNYYWSCFFSIANGIVKYFKDKGSMSDDSKYLIDGNLDLKKAIFNIKDFIKEIYGYDIKDDESYYSHINKKLSDKIHCSGLITTNYFHFAEKLIHVKNTAYLNGKLSLFEFPENLEVLDLIEDCLPENKLFFPFLFGQSFLKPVVVPEQTEEFHKYKEILDATDILVVLGYSFSRDDNHVNSFIHKFLKEKKKKLIYVAHDCLICSEDEQITEKKILEKKLYFTENAIQDQLIIVPCKKDVDVYLTNEEVVDSIFQKITEQNINTKNINEANTFEQNASL